MHACFPPITNFDKKIDVTQLYTHATAVYNILPRHNSTTISQRQNWLVDAYLLLEV